MTKIVCIGWSKTGTGSVGKMLRMLGYRTTQRPPKAPGKDIGPLHADFIPRRVLPLLKTHDAFHDFPWAYWFPLIDRLHPGSKFIYTHRKDAATWLASCEAFYMEPNETSQYLYNGHGMPDSPEAKRIWKARYMQHDAFVRAYFKDSEQLLTIDIDAGELAWERLCRFLGRPVPKGKQVPHLNKRKNSAVVVRGTWSPEYMRKYGEVLAV